MQFWTPQAQQTCFVTGAVLQGQQTCVGTGAVAPGPEKLCWCIQNPKTFLLEKVTWGSGFQGGF